MPFSRPPLSINIPNQASRTTAAREQKKNVAAPSDLRAGRPGSGSGSGPGSGSGSGSGFGSGLVQRATWLL